MIERGDEEQKRSALFIIRNLKTDTASRIALPALNDPNEMVRATAVFSLIYLPKKEVVRALLPLLADKSELVRRETAYALGEIADPTAVDALLKIIESDRIYEVRTAAIVSLGRIGDIAALEPLTRILQSKPDEKRAFMRRSAARSIGQIALRMRNREVKISTPESFLPEDKKNIEHPKNFDLLNRFPFFRESNEILIRILQNERETADVRREVAFALGAIGDRSSVPFLRSALSVSDYYLAEISREALLRIESQ